MYLKRPTADYPFPVAQSQAISLEEGTSDKNLSRLSGYNGREKEYSFDI